MSNDRIFERCFYIQGSSRQVWAALVDPAVVSLYYLTPLKHIDLRVGGKIVYGPADIDLIEGEILELIDEQRLVHSFRFTFRPAEHSRVTYNIEKYGDALSCIHLIHSDFRDDDTYNDVSAGWDRILSSLKTLIESGRPLQWRA